MISKMLVATDGSEDAMEAAAYAAAMARHFGARVTLLHVVEIPRVPLFLPDFSVDQRERVRRELWEAGQAILAMTERPFVDANVPVRVMLREGRAPDVIAEVAAEEGQELIVMGSHGLTPAARLLLGSVSQKVIHIAPCPVLIVRKDTARA